MCERENETRVVFLMKFVILHPEVLDTLRMVSARLRARFRRLLSDAWRLSFEALCLLFDVFDSWL